MQSTEVFCCQSTAETAKKSPGRVGKISALKPWFAILKSWFAILKTWFAILKSWFAKGYTCKHACRNSSSSSSTSINC